MEGSEFARCGGMGAVAFHLFVEAIGEDEVVGELESMRLHGVRGTIVEVAHFRVIEVRHALL